MSRNFNPTPQFFDSAGDPLANGKMFYFDSGTSDAKDTFADVNLTTLNSHPVLLTGDGRLPNVFYNGSAKQVLTDSDSVQIWERDPVSSTDSSSFGENWDAITIYSLNEVVSFNDILYVSIINSNQNNDPSSTPTAWTQFDLVKRWNTNETYKVRDPVIATDFTLYMSLIGSNTGNDPISSPSEWVASGAGSGGTFAFSTWDLSIDYGVGVTNIVEGSDTNYYVSIQTPNLNQDPTSSPTFWTEIDFIEGGNITIIGGTIASTTTDSDVDVVPNGTGLFTYESSEVLNRSILADNAFSWDAAITYPKGARVYGSDDNWYISLAAANLNNNPTSVPASWSQLAGLTLFNTNETYEINDACQASNGITYISAVNTNLGNDPIADDGTNWTGVTNEDNTFQGDNDFTGGLKKSGSEVVPVIAAGNTTGGTLNYGTNVASVTDGGLNGSYRRILITLTNNASAASGVLVGTCVGQGAASFPLDFGIGAQGSANQYVFDAFFSHTSTTPAFADCDLSFTIVDIGL